MKIILTLLVIIPLVLSAQSKKNRFDKLPLIESMTSDTVKGTYYQILFLYDESDRVVSITNKVLKIAISSETNIEPAEQIIKQQTFEYKGTDLAPFSRRLVAYEYDENNKKWYLASNEQQYFLYKNGQRVGDSSFLSEMNVYDMKWDKKTKKRIGFLEQKNGRIYHEMDLTKPGNDPVSSYYNIYTDELKLTPKSNIGYTSSEYRHDNHGGGQSYYTLFKYDTMFNPLKQLNIANSLANDNLCLFNGRHYTDFSSSGVIYREGKYGDVDLNWYFVNQNNPLNYFVTVNDQTSPFKYIFECRYTYNHFKQPIYAKTKVRLVFNGSGKFYSKHQAHITFKYKK